MALFQLDTEQFEHLDARLTELTQAVNDLSANLGKWQGTQTAAIQTGFASLIAALTGADVAEVQQRINTLAETIKTEADALEQSTKQPEGE